jgi:DNA-binding transcriptional MerR regulator
VADGWTLDELVARVERALAVDGVRAPNGRIRDVPDARALRWYATIGLLDRPTTFRGRTALYGPRHLLQAVAVKRRQADGMALAEIQSELSGATDSTLRRVARVPTSLLTDAPAAIPAAIPAESPAALAEVRSPRASFWRTAPAAAPAPAAARPAAPRQDATRPDATPLDTTPLDTTRPETTRAAQVSGAEPRHLVRLGPGATLVLTAAPSAADVADLRAAAAPLLSLLADRALLTAQESRDDDD